MQAFLYIFRHGQPPAHDVPIAVVIGGNSVPFLGALMYNLDDLIYEYKDFNLQVLSGLGELPDLTNGENHVNSTAWDLELHKALVVGQRSRDDQGTFFTEASL